jgi:4'-phosphopantetheinyl transferase
MSDQDVWRHIPPDGIAISTGQVHVWRASLETPTSTLRRLQDLLSVEEIEQAERFHFEIDRRRWIVARGVLRTLLGQYLGRAPQTSGLATIPTGNLR